MSLDSCLDDAQLLALVEHPDAQPGSAEHLAGCDDCRERLHRLREDVALIRDTACYGNPRWANDGKPSTTHAQQDLPSTIGPYMVLEWLGRGGEADVFRAEHPVLRHNVALKWSRRPLQGDAEPLVAEGRLLASLDVEGVARVFDLGLHEGRPYLVMQMLRGRTLHRFATEASLSHREIARLVAQVARILAGAHANQVWHRDLKPSNIIIGADGSPTIIDFGMAGFCQPWRDDAPCSGGTLHFMSPEQAKELLGVCDERTGALPVVGPRSDIFALGAILYSLLTEHAPYPRESSPELIDRVCRGDFDRQQLSARGIPKRLAAICLKAMSYDPAQRYPSADDMAHALERFARPARRTRWLLGTCVLVSLMTCLAFVLWKHQAEIAPVVVDHVATQQTSPPSVTAQVAEYPDVAPVPPAATSETVIEPPPPPDVDDSTTGDEDVKRERSRRVIKPKLKDEKAARSEPKPKSRWCVPRWFRDRSK